MATLGDFVAQCDNLAGTLPHFGDRFTEMTRDAEDMAKQLEERMRFIEDGYEHLGAVAGQIPEAFREVASMHRKSMVDAAGILDIEDKENESAINKQISYLKRELQSIAQERVVVDVFTRGTISRAKRHHGKQASGDGEAAVLEHDRSRASKIAGKRGTESGLAGTSAVRASTQGTDAPSLLQTRAPKAGDQLAQQMVPESGGANVYNHMTRSELMSTIHMPDFNPAHVDDETSTAVVAVKAMKRQPRVQHSDKPPQVRHVQSDSVVVPSMKHTLPEELSGLRTTPTTAPISDYRSKTSVRRSGSAQRYKASTDGGKSVIVPIAKALRAELKRNKHDMEALRSEVHEAQKDMQAERIAARRVMRTVAAGLENRMVATEENIKSEVQAVVDGAFDRLTGTLLDIDGRRDRRERDDEDYEPRVRESQDAVELAEVVSSTRQYHQQQPSTAPAAVEREEKTKYSTANPVVKYLLSQKGVQYDKHGRKVNKSPMKSRARHHTPAEYDQNGRIVHHKHSDVDETNSGNARASSLPPSPKSHKPNLTVETPIVGSRSPLASSPRATSNASTFASSSTKPVEAQNKDQSTTMPSDAETYVDPHTGTAYRIMGVSSRGHTRQRTVGQGPFWERRTRSEAAAPQNEHVAVASATSVPTAADGAPSATPAAYTPFHKTLSIYRPVQVPLSKEELLTQAERKRAEELKILKTASEVRQEFSLVLGPSGVQWHATQIPIDMYRHPDVPLSQIGSGGEGALPYMAGLLKRECAPGDVQRPGLEEGKSTKVGQERSLVTALGVVEGGGRLVEMKGQDAKHFHFQREVSKNTPGDDEDEIAALGSAKGHNTAQRGALATGPMIAPPRKGGLPNPDITRAPAVPLSSRNGPPPDYGASSAHNVEDEDIFAGGSISKGEDKQVSFTSRVQTASGIHDGQSRGASTPVKSQTDSNVSQAEAVTDDRSVRPVSVLNAPVIAFNLTNGEGGMPDDGAADEVDTVETFTGLDAHNDNQDDGWEISSEGGGDVKLSSSALPEELALLPPLGSPTQATRTRTMSDSMDAVDSTVKSMPAPENVSAAASIVFTPASNSLVMQSLSSPIGQQLIQRVPVLRDAVAASAAATVTSSAVVSVPIQAPANIPSPAHTHAAASPILSAAPAMPGPQEFAAALIEAMRAISAATVPVPVPVPVSTLPVIEQQKSVSMPMTADEMRQQVREGIESGVQQALAGIKKKALAAKEQRDKQEEREARASAVTAKAQRAIPSTAAGGISYAEAVLKGESSATAAAALPNQVKIMDLGAKTRSTAKRVSAGSFVPLVSSIVGSSSTMRAAALSIDSDSTGADDSVDTIEQVFQNVRLVPGLEGLCNLSARNEAQSYNQRRSPVSSMSFANGVGLAPGSQSQSYVFAGGDVSSSDDWTEIGPGGVGLVKNSTEDDELAALAELSLRDDNSFVEALKSRSGHSSPTMRRTATSMLSSSVESIEDGVDGIESIPLE